jgi:hypothetical protein
MGLHISTLRMGLLTPHKVDRSDQHANIVVCAFLLDGTTFPLSVALLFFSQEDILRFYLRFWRTPHQPQNEVLRLA